MVLSMLVMQYICLEIPTMPADQMSATVAPASEGAFDNSRQRLSLSIHAGAFDVECRQDVAAVGDWIASQLPASASVVQVAPHAVRC